MRRRIGGLLLASLVLLVSAEARADGDEDDMETIPPADPVPQENEQQQEGEASWYGPGFHGRLTANGETFDQDAFTAAHRWLPFGTEILVTNLDNGCSVSLRVTDRGPFHGARILDCSRAGAEALGFIDDGTARIRWNVISWPAPRKKGLRLGYGPPVASSEKPLIAPPRLHEPPIPIGLETP